MSFGFFANQTFASAPVNNYVANNGSLFDGTNDYLTINEELLPSFNQVSFSMWIRPLDLSKTQHLLGFYRSGDNKQFVVYFQPQLGTNGLVTVVIGDTGTGTRFNTQGEFSSPIISGEWMHILISANGSSAPNVFNFYVNGSALSFTAGSTRAWQFATPYNSNNFQIGDRPELLLKYNGEFQELWYDDTFIDFTNATNRNKFLLAGKPVDLGSNGSTPTGSQPLIYLKNPFATFQNNLGTLGNFTVVGALAEGTAPEL